MTQATNVLIEQLRQRALALVDVAETDFNKFVVPIVRDLDLILLETSPEVRALLQRAMDLQLQAGVPELARVTGARQAADTIAGLTSLGANLLVELVTSGAAELTDMLGGQQTDGGGA